MGPVARKFVGLASALCLGTAMALASVVASAREWREVRDPYFGVVLFDFYQDNYFSALSQLMTSQHFERVSHHADETELLRGGMLLSYGLHQEAGRIFQALIDAGAPPPVRDRAWFFLAKIRYQRGYIAEAEDAVSHIQGKLPGELEDERRVLQAFLLLRRQQYTEAVAMLRQVSQRSSWGAYGRYNLGVALVRAGERDAGIALLDALGREPVRGEELLALRDKANVALAYVFLQDELPALARPYLERVRLNGLMSNKALLGLGWSQAALGQHERALVSWSELTNRDLADTAVQESLLAVPFALSKLGAYKQSLERYEKGLEAYTQERTRLDQAIDAIRRGALVESILRDNPGDEAGWYWRVAQVPDSPESRYLTELLASHDFQEGLKNYRDLRFLIRNLETWAVHMGVYDTALATRRQGYAERLPRVLAGQRALAVDRLRGSYVRETEELARIERDVDTEALATDKERALLARLKRVRAGMAQLTDPGERAAAQEKFRLLQGLITWDLSADYSARLWQAQKQMKQMDGLFEQAEARRQALTQAQAEMPAQFENFDKRIQALRRRIAALQGQTAVAARAQEGYLAELAVGELLRRREQIEAYVTQARFAVAQIVDEALRAAEKTP